MLLSCCHETQNIYVASALMILKYGRSFQWSKSRISNAQIFLRSVVKLIQGKGLMLNY